MLLQLITDRTKEHVNLRNRLLKKGWSNLTASEQSDWYTKAAKGAYNYTDLNRVEEAVAELATLFRLTLVTKTNWNQWDIPSESDMNRYLANVIAVRDACPGDATFPTLPSTMSRLTYSGANNIEKVLEIAHEAYRAYCDRYVQSGEIYSGEV